MTRKLLCATDGSHSSAKAVDFAVELAAATGAHLTFLTVNRVTRDDLANSHFWDSDTIGAANAQLQHELQAAVTKAKAAGLRSISCATCEGHNIGAAIVDFADRNGYSQLIAGSVGRTGVARMLLGSIAQEIVVKAHCPVTVVR